MSHVNVATGSADDSRRRGAAKVLVVDDNPANRLGVRKALRGVDVELHEADSGFDALSLSLENDYAVILLDVRMSSMDGFEVCAHLRANPKTAETPVVLMTAAYTSAEDAIAGYAEGATDYLAKPISDRVLCAKVRVFLRLFRQRQALRDAIETADRAKAEAERASLARSKFLAAASHDLRQPVQTLMMLMAVLTRQENSPQVAAVAGKMEGALAGLNRLLNGTLEVSRLDAGAVMPQMQAVDAGQLLSWLSQEYGVVAAGKGLRVRCFSRPWLVRADPALLERAMRNLIENALRYTSKGGVHLGMRRRGERARIDVRDTGVGIPGDHLPYIFEEFYQSVSPAGGASQGLGLGLSIVTRIVRLLGAEIRVSSREGRGSCFSLLIPLEPAESRPSPDLSAHGDDLSAHSDAAGCLLVIEDNPALLAGLQMMLQGWGYEVLAAANGEGAVELGEASRWRLDAVIADHRLGPGLTGAATAREIRARSGRSVPTLIITGDTDPACIAEARANGFAMLHKPVGAEELRLKVGRLLREQTAAVSA
jgi:two-component system, sensor histidine kinase